MVRTVILLCDRQREDNDPAVSNHARVMNNESSVVTNLFKNCFPLFQIGRIRIAREFLPIIEGTCCSVLWSLVVRRSEDITTRYSRNSFYLSSHLISSATQFGTSAMYSRAKTRNADVTIVLLSCINAILVDPAVNIRHYSQAIHILVAGAWA